MSANDILNSKSPRKKVKEINPYAPGGPLWDRTTSVNYDPLKEKRVNDLRERLKEIERLKQIEKEKEPVGMGKAQEI
jgi:hypothetical protein